MRRFVCAAVVAVFAVSVALAEDIRVMITKVDKDAKTISFKKLPAEKGGEFGEEMTAKLTATAKIYTGKFNPDTKKLEADTEKALDVDALAERVAKGGKGGGKGKKKGGGVAVITTDDGGKTVSQIIVGGGGGKKKKKDAN
jgi:hypothetical protein